MHPLLPGLKAALNYHPIFVHFPIALWFAALFFELLGTVRANDHFHRTAVWLLYLGTLAGCVTALSGLYAEDSVPSGPAQAVVELHENVMLTALSLSVGLCLFAFFTRKSSAAGLRRALLLGLVILAALVTYGADRGAQLVYQYGASVNWPAAQQQGQAPK